MNKPLSLSIVIPAYNEEDHILACLKAIAAQTIPPDEVIVVDNNSTDRTVARAREFTFVTIVRESTQGVVFARNRGFNAAKGDIIGRIDADTVLPPDWVEYVHDFYSTNPMTLLTGGCYFYDLHWPKFFGWVQGQIAFRMNRIILGHYISWGSNMAIPAAMWRNIRSELCARTDIHEDIDLSIHLRRHGYTVTYREGLKVGIDSRTANQHNRAQQLEYMEMWPQTVRVHHLHGAALGEIGKYLVYYSFYILKLINFTSALFNKIKTKVRFQ